MLLERTELSLTAGCEDLRDGLPGLHLDDAVGVDERPSESLCAQLPDGGLSRTHEPDQHEVADRLRTHVSDARYASWFRTTSGRESPPNFRSASPASTRATIDSATMPDAGTAVTSVRSLNDTV